MTENTADTKSRDYKAYVEKDPTSLHEHLARWIEEKTGMKSVDTKTVQLAVSLYADFQASPENKARQAQEKAEREAAREAAKSQSKGGARSPEAKELKKLLQAKELLESTGQPVPAKTAKRIEELQKEVQVPTQVKGGEVREETPEQVQAAKQAEKADA